MQLLACSVPLSPCPEESQVLVASWLSDLILNGGFDPDSFGVAFGGALVLWATGLAIGLIVAQIRKIRLPT